MSPGSSPQADEHALRLQALSRPGGPLAPDGPYASIRNPRWFRQLPVEAAPRRARRALHDALMDRWARANPNVTTDGQAILLAGPPGAGKSTALADLGETLGIPLERWRVVNSDDFKDLLLEPAIAEGTLEELKPPEVAALERAGERFWPRELAAIIHQEAGRLVARAIRQTVAAGENLIMDGTLSHADKAWQLADRLQQAGYAITIVSVDGPQDAIDERILHRWRTDYLAAEEGVAEGPAARLGGRWVPSEVPNELYDQGREESRCATVARELAMLHPAVLEYFEYRVARADAAPELVSHLGRAARGSALLAAEHLGAARRARAGDRQPRRGTPRRR